MKSPPQISIIMPVFNGQDYIKDSVLSLLNQSCHDFELIIVDDHSTDNTLSIVEELKAKDPRIKILTNNLSKGISGAINSGLSIARGEYIARADADDINKLYRLEHQLNFIKSNNKFVIIGGGYAPFNNEGHRIDIYHPTNPLILAWKFMFDSFFAHPTIMVKTQILKEFNGYQNTAAEDYILFSSILRKYMGSNLKEILIDYREHSTNVSKSQAHLMASIVEKQSKENFKFWAGGLTGYGQIKKMFLGEKLKLADLVIIIRINSKILNKIRETYRLGIFNYFVFEFEIFLFKKYIQCLLKK